MCTGKTEKAAVCTPTRPLRLSENAPTDARRILALTCEANREEKI